MIGSGEMHKLWYNSLNFSTVQGAFRNSFFRVAVNHYVLMIQLRETIIELFQLRGEIHGLHMLNVTFSNKMLLEFKILSYIENDRIINILWKFQVSTIIRFK